MVGGVGWWVVVVCKPISVLSFGFGQSEQQTDIARLGKLQYRAAKVVTGALHFTSKDKLNSELGWETIMERGDFLGLNIFQKIHLHETRPLIRSCMPKLDLEQKITRSKGGYKKKKNNGHKFKTSFFPYFLSISLNKSCLILSIFLIVSFFEYYKIYLLIKGLLIET